MKSYYMFKYLFCKIEKDCILGNTNLYLEWVDSPYFRIKKTVWKGKRIRYEKP